jgi:hypothetical protein
MVEKLHLFVSSMPFLGLTSQKNSHPIDGIL